MELHIEVDAWEVAAAKFEILHLAATKPSSCKDCTTRVLTFIRARVFFGSLVTEQLKKLPTRNTCYVLR